MLKLLENPYSDDTELSPSSSVQAMDGEEDSASCSTQADPPVPCSYDQKPPDWSLDLRVT